MPLIRRIPKRGFGGKRQAHYQIVNLEALKKIKEEVISPEELQKYGMVKSAVDPVKILGTGEISKPVTVKSHAFSTSAKEKIEKAGGRAEVISS